jgi:hypothetical protein
MTQEEDYQLKILELKMNQILNLLAEQKAAEQKKDKFKDLPEWVNIETAAARKGGAALSTYKTKLFLQPCCGRNFRYQGGRKSWRKADVIEWLDITDSGLKAYAEKWEVKIPANYVARAA